MKRQSRLNLTFAAGSRCPVVGQLLLGIRYGKWNGTARINDNAKPASGDAELTFEATEAPPNANQDFTFEPGG
jgi:hypothetical protein